MRGWLQKNMKWVNRIADGVSTVGAFIPGWGQLAAGIAQGVKTVAGWAAKGKVSIGDAVQNMGSFVLGKLKMLNLPGWLKFGK